MWPIPFERYSSSINQINSFVFYFHWKYISLIFIALKSTITYTLYILSIRFDLNSRLVRDGNFSVLTLLIKKSLDSSIILGLDLIVKLGEEKSKCSRPFIDQSEFETSKRGKISDSYNLHSCCKFKMSNFRNTDERCFGSSVR